MQIINGLNSNHGGFLRVSLVTKFRVIRQFFHEISRGARAGPYTHMYKYI